MSRDPRWSEEEKWGQEPQQSSTVSDTDQQSTEDTPTEDFDEDIARPSWLDKIRGGVSTKEVTKDEVAKAREELAADPNKEKNGWTPEKLAAYHKGRGGDFYTPRTARRRPKRTNGKHNPHRWRQ